jgi:predicted nucleotidyltransferase
MHPDWIELLQLLRSHDVKFLVVGSTALAVHARPRFTEDIDLWLEKTEENVRRLSSALNEFGLPIDEDKLKPFWQQERQMVTLGAKPHRMDLLNFLADDSFGDAWDRGVIADLSGVDVKVIGVEDFIRAKRAAGRPKDLADLELLKEVLGTLPE